MSDEFAAVRQVPTAAFGDPDGNRIELSESPCGRLTGDYAP